MVDRPATDLPAGWVTVSNPAKGLGNFPRPADRPATDRPATDRPAGWVTVSNPAEGLGNFSRPAPQVWPTGRRPTAQPGGSG